MQACQLPESTVSCHSNLNQDSCETGPLAISKKKQLDRPSNSLIRVEVSEVYPIQLANSPVWDDGIPGAKTSNKFYCVHDGLQKVCYNTIMTQVSPSLNLLQINRAYPWYFVFLL